MKKSSRAVKAVMSGGMFMNSSSSNESNSDDDKCHLPTAESILSDKEKHHQADRVIIRRTLSRLKRQQATTSLQSPLRKTSSLESIDDDDDHDNHDLIMSDPIILNDIHQTEENLHRTSFNESERTDSGIGRDSGSSWRLSSYCDSFHHHHQPSQQLHPPPLAAAREQEQEQQLDKQQESDHDELDVDSPPRPPLNPICHTLEDSIDRHKLQKAGWLHTKHWLTVQRHQKIDLASKRQWKRYWTCLKGSTLFFYNDYSDMNSKFSLSIVESLCYPLPEHPHRQHVFSLTTRFGDTYCFQASDQSELDHWIRNVHCHSSTKTNEFQLKNAVEQIEENIARENKMRKLADLQLKSSTSQKVRLLISKQMDLWEKNLEAYQVDLFRHKCYLCALTNDRQLPNPKDLLAQACPATKAALHKLGAFTPCSFYSCIAARRRTDRSILKVKSDPKPSTDEQPTKTETKCYLTTPSSPILTATVADRTILQMVTSDSNSPMQKTIVSINESATVGELLKRVTDKLNLQIDDHFLYFDASSPAGFIPNRNVKLNQLIYSSVEVRRKAIYQVTLDGELQASGVDIETELYREYSLQVIVSNVRKESEADRLGIRTGDEIVMIHDAIVQDLDLNTLDTYLSQIPILLTIRSARSTEPAHNHMHRSLDLSQSIIQNLICPPPPRRIERLSRQEIRDLVVPKPDPLCHNDTKTVEAKETRVPDPCGSALERLFKNVDELSRYCRPTTNLCENDTESIAPINPTPRIKALSNAQRIRKVIFELVETERSYVQDMQRLLERYIEPLRDDSKLLPGDVIESLYVSVKSIHQLQMTFLERLESNVPTQILAYNAIHEFRDILIAIAETFLSYSQYFKLYSTFCAMHLRINRLLDIHQNNQHLKDFLAARNPRHQHSSSFESYLIKPVQRILKYPLLLQQICNFASVHLDVSDSAPPLSSEICRLKQAITMMNEIGEYMNAMQQLYEDFGQSFEQMIKTYSEERNQTLLLNLPDLYAYGEIDWTNIHQFLLRKHYHRLKSYCFVFRHGCLILTREQANKKKQDLLSIHKGPKINIDRYIRFIPIEELTVELAENETFKENICTWQLIETDPKTRLKTHFRFANKEAQTFVNTIQNCISCSAATVEWRTNTAERSNMSIRNSDPSQSAQNSNSQQRIASSRSCHVLLPTNGWTSVDQPPPAPTRSPSPVWKRRTTPVRKQPLSMNIRRKTLKNSTDC